MSRRPIVLDANVVVDRTFMHWLEDYHERKIIPVVAYCELLYVFVCKYGSGDKLDRLLHAAGVRTERMDWKQAKLAAEIGANIKNAEWKRNARDYMIAAFAYEAPWILVTKDLRNFAYLSPRAMTPYDFMDEFR